jgi:apolipoprotein N-acyltransferase
MATILRLFVLYEPLKTFAYVGLPFFLFGIALWVRYLALLLVSGAQGHIQSVVVGAVSILMALLLWSLGVVGELLATNRRILDETLYYAKRAALHNESRVNPSGDTE